MPPAVGYAIAGIATGAGMYGASRANSKATERASAAQLQGSREAEQFARQREQATWQDAETARRGNYDLWASRQQALNNYRQQYGYGQTRIPDYVPSVDPGFVGSAGDPRTTRPAPPTNYAGPGADSWRAPAGVRPTRPAPMGALMGAPAVGAVGDYLSPSLRQTMRPPRQAKPNKRSGGDIGFYLQGGR